MALKEVLPAYLKPVRSFAYFSGWRRGEVLGLKWASVNLTDGIVRGWNRGKTRTEKGEPSTWNRSSWSLREFSREVDGWTVSMCSV